MSKNKIITVSFLIGIVGVLALFPDVAFAQFGAGGFENRVKGLTNSLITVILPAVSILGLIYAAILAATGDAAAKGRMVLIIIASVVGFLAPIIIRWFQSAAGV